MKKSKDNNVGAQDNKGLTNYSEYEMSFGEKAAYFAGALATASTVGYLFYFNIYIAAALGVIAGTIFVPMRRKQIIEKRKKMLRLQFKDMLEALSTSINAGKNVPDAFRSAYDDLRIQYSPEDDIICELEIILSGLNNNINIEQSLMDFGNRSGIEDILSFANVFDTCYRKGGNIKDVITNTFKIINDKIEIVMEIDTVVTEKKTEHTMMSIMPIVLVVIMRLFGGSDSAKNLSSGIGMAATTIAIVMFVIAYFVGKKILQIKL